MRKSMKDRIRRAKELRKIGFLYREIAAELGVSITMARYYALGLTFQKRSSTLPSCGKVQPDKTLKCERLRDHPGIHLANDKENRLIYWE